MCNSIWQASVNLPKFLKLNKDIKTDVLIIGGGMVGILTAFMLKERGVNYTLVEKERVCGGVTGKTTAKITYQHGLIYSKISKAYGIDTAKAYLIANKQAFNKLLELCKVIECDYRLLDNYVYSCDSYKKLDDELKALALIGCNAEFCSNLEIPIKTVGAVKFFDQAQFNPLKFASGLIKDMNIYENTFVRELDGTTAVTDHGKIRAKKVIVATHFPFINKHGSYFLKLYQHRSYVLALNKAPNYNGMYVDESNKGMSFRNYGDNLLIGGGGHRTGKQGGNFDELRRFAKEHYSECKEIFHWATQDCMSLDGISYIGRYSKNTPNLFTATGFNKWGMTGSMLSAMMLSDMVLDKPNEFAEVFSPSRNILKPQLMVNGLETTKNLLTISKKRCSHLGCALKWNGAEHSWDCACHGSRFSESGEILDNPANSDLI